MSYDDVHKAAEEAIPIRNSDTETVVQLKWREQDVFARGWVLAEERLVPRIQELEVERTKIPTLLRRIDELEEENARLRRGQ